MIRALILSLILLSCDDLKDEFVGYWIFEGEHPSVPITNDIVERLIDSGHLRFDAWFSIGCNYSLDGLGEDKYDLNKLYGFTDCNESVHETSARFVWRHKGNDTIEVFNYLYRSGKLVTPRKMGETVLDARNEYEIWQKGDWYKFRFNSERDSFRRTKEEDNICFRVRLYPWFGGNRVAPNDMMIVIHEL